MHIVMRCENCEKVFTTSEIPKCCPYCTSKDIKVVPFSYGKVCITTSSPKIKALVTEQDFWKRVVNSIYIANKSREMSFDEDILEFLVRSYGLATNKFFFVNRRQTNPPKDSVYFELLFCSDDKYYIVGILHCKEITDEHLSYIELLSETYNKFGVAYYPMITDKANFYHVLKKLLGEIDASKV